MDRRDRLDAREILDRVGLFALTPCRSQAHPILNLAVGIDADFF
jgi:hypothetical protein